jgi:purine-nucleoside phosphorylase
MMEKINRAADYIKSKINATPEVGVILGSGLGNFGNRIENSIKIPYEEIPEFPVSTVEGHSGNLYLATWPGKK